MQKGGIKNLFPNLTGHNISAELVHFSHERRGSKVDLENKVVQDEKFNINGWCGYQ